MMAFRALHTLIILFPSLVLSYHISVLQENSAPETKNIARNSWWSCYRLSSPKEPLLGLAIYNARFQNHFPDGFQFYTDRLAGCGGEPSLIITLSKRPGVYFVNLEKLGLSKVFTCWRIYDLQVNTLKLKPLHPESKREGYAERSIEDMAFIKSPETGNWIEVAELKDIPKSDKNGYTENYLEEYGTPPKGHKSWEKWHVVPWIENNLKKWSDAPTIEDPQGANIKIEAIPRVPFTQIEQPRVFPNIPVQNQRWLIGENDMPPPSTEGMNRGYSVGSFDHMRHLIERPIKPVESRPGTQRMYEILKQNAQQRLKIPSPENAFGLDSLKPELTMPDLLDEVGRLTRDPESSDVELGWALVRLATMRDNSLMRKEGGGVEHFQFPLQRPEGTAEMGTERVRSKNSALLDLSDLSEVDASTELKVNKDTAVPPIPIARNLGPVGVAPPRPNTRATMRLMNSDNDDEDLIEPYGRRQQTETGINPPIQVQELQGEPQGPTSNQNWNGATSQMEEEGIRIFNDMGEREGFRGNEENLDLGLKGRTRRSWEESLLEAGLEDIESLADSPRSGDPIIQEDLQDWTEIDFD
ncbi:hypothetical protein TWF506_007320 [Arthrobotrys conoides]|uniref:Uncharacterized protein n=1 Tax=Arthrobotrys conoides TaxID=74498 RepID=A0AAN8RZH9_9PEZI